jgi:hypothetical protein
MDSSWRRQPCLSIIISALMISAAVNTSAAQEQHQVQRALLLDVVVSEGAAVLHLLAREDEALLVGANAVLVLDLGIHSLLA